jgi:hypothetical protein
MKTKFLGNFLLSPIIPLTVDCGGGGSGNKQSQVVEMRLFRLVSCMILSICIFFNVAGCATPAALRYADRQANEPPTYRTILDVNFAALHGPDQLRLCVLIPADSTGESSPATLKINLAKISESLTERGTTSHDNTSFADSSIGVGSKLRNECEPALQGAEEMISIVRIQLEGTDLVSALQQLAPEELTVFVLEQNGKSHIVVGSPDQDFPGMNHEAFNAYAEDNASKAGYLLVPLAIVADVVIVAVYVLRGFLCVFGKC